jgi:hypothetical protein
MAVPLTPSPDRRGVTVGRATALFQTRIALGAVPGANKQYMVGAGGQRFLINVISTDVADTPITLLLPGTPGGRMP